MGGVIGETTDTAQVNPVPGAAEHSPPAYPPFSITSKTFLLAALVERAVSVVPTKDFQPVLRNILVQVEAGRLLLSATDLELSVLAATEAVTTVLPDGHASVQAVLPARKLLVILRTAPEGNVTIRVEGPSATVNAGSASWQLRLVSGEDYPVLPDLSKVEFRQASRAQFIAALKAVRHAIGRDGGRPQLMMVRIAGGMATASDGARFAQVRLDFPLDICVPAAGTPTAVDELVRMCGSVDTEHISVGETEHALVFVVGSHTFIAAKLMAKYPDVEAQILKPALTNQDVLEVQRADLAAAIKRVRVTADPETSAVGLRIEAGGTSLTVFARDKTGNSAQQVIDAKWEGKGRLLVVNHAYLQEMLAGYPAETCRFMLGAETTKRRGVVLLWDEDSGTRGILYQMLASMVGY